jgi:hypothetical protein
MPELKNLGPESSKWVASYNKWQHIARVAKIWVILPQYCFLALHKTEQMVNSSITFLHPGLTLANTSHVHMCARKHITEDVWHYDGFIFIYFPTYEWKA